MGGEFLETSHTTEPHCLRAVRAARLGTFNCFKAPFRNSGKTVDGSGSAPIINNVKRKWHLYQGSIRGFIGTVTVPGCFGLSADHCVTGVYFGIVVSGEPGSQSALCYRKRVIVLGTTELHFVCPLPLA